MNAPLAVDLHIQQLVADVSEGRRPRALERYIQRACGPSTQGMLASMIFGGGPTAVDVYGISPYAPICPFARSRLFWVRASGASLETSVLPGRARSGLFAVGPGGYRYLSRRPHELEGLFNDEACSVGDLSPEPLADLFVYALGQQGNSGHCLVADPAELESATPLRGWPQARGYVLRPEEWTRVRDRLAPPSLTSDGQGGWVLEFFALFGWMHDKRRLCRLAYTIRCSPPDYRAQPADFRVSEQIETISRELFAKTPGIRY